MKIAVVKYNAGNIYSVDYALKRLGVEATITSDKEVLMSADKVIFPGVGEAETTMSHLRKNRLDEVIKNLKQPVLGICLGMQLMCRHSEEGNADCLGIFDTDVKLFSPTRHEDKVPHMGWNTLAHVRSDLFKGFTKEDQRFPQNGRKPFRECKIISMRHSSIPKRAEPWANES